jgi:hypothetical protein
MSGRRRKRLMHFPAGSRTPGTRSDGVLLITGTPFLFFQSGIGVIQELPATALIAETQLEFLK